MNRSLLILSILMLLVFFSCEQVSATVPSDHTVKMGDISHKPGLNVPQTNCVECHGEDLRGGSASVSCYDCHSKNWGIK